MPKSGLRRESVTVRVVLAWLCDIVVLGNDDAGRLVTGTGILGESGWSISSPVPFGANGPTPKSLGMGLYVYHCPSVLEYSIKAQSRLSSR